MDTVILVLTAFFAVGWLSGAISMIIGMMLLGCDADDNGSALVTVHFVVSLFLVIAVGVGLGEAFAWPACCGALAVALSVSYPEPSPYLGAFGSNRIVGLVFIALLSGAGAVATFLLAAVAVVINAWFRFDGFLYRLRR